MLYARDSDSSLEPSLAVALLEKQTQLCAIQLKCNFWGHRGLIQKPEDVSLFGAGSTPQDMPSHAWKDRLIDTLSRDARYQHQTVVQMVGEVCRDLEARCDNAEQPFRDEQAKSQYLQRRLKASEERNMDLEGQRERSCLVINVTSLATLSVVSKRESVISKSERILLNSALTPCKSNWIGCEKTWRMWKQRLCVQQTPHQKLLANKI